MKTIRCSTLFDITVTGVDGHSRSATWPVTTRTGMILNSHDELLRARNQQRNFDTVIQVISMRTQPFNISTPELLSLQQFSELSTGNVFTKATKIWSFEFDIESADPWLLGDDEFAHIKSDSIQVPMIVGLTEDSGLDSWLVIQGSEQNIIYESKS